MSHIWKRLTVITYDDQSPQLAQAYSGNWLAVQGGIAATLNNGTMTLSETPGSTFQFTFDGTQAVIFGAVANGSAFPLATYSIDGASAGSISPYINANSQVVYFLTPELSSANHTVLATVTQANSSSPFILDSVAFVPSGTMATSMTLSASSSSTGVSSTSQSHTGAIVGGTVGGIAALAALLLLVFFVMRRKRGRPYYFDKPNTGDLLGTEALPFPPSPPPNTQQYSPQPFAPPSSYPSGGNPDVYSSTTGRTSYIPLPNNVLPPPSEGEGMSSSSGRQRTEKGMIPMNAQNEPEAIQHADSGLRFGGGRGPSALPTEIPPSYSAS